MENKQGQPGLAVPGSSGGAVSVVGKQFCVRNSEHLAITVSSRSKDGFKGFIVSNADGAVFLRVKVKSGGFLSRSRQLVEDTSGNTLLTLQAKASSWSYRQCAFRGNSKDPNDMLFSVKMSSRFRWKTTEFDVFLVANTREKVSDFKFESRSGLEECTFYGAADGSRASPLARVTKDKKPFQLFGSVKDSWTVDLEPEVDYAFAVALFVMVVNIEAERASGSAAAASSAAAAAASSAAASSAATAGGGC